MCYIFRVQSSGDSARGASSPEVSDLLLKQIATLRRKLFDLTARNPLIAFKHSSKARLYIRVIDEVPDQLYRHLEEDKPLRFRSLGPRDGEPPEEKTLEFRRALEIARLEDPEYLQALREAGPDPGDRILERIDRELRNRLRANLAMPPRGNDSEFTSAHDTAVRLGLNPSFDLPSAAPIERRHRDDKIQTLLFDDELEPRLSALAARVRVSLEETGVNPLFCVFGFLEWFESDSSETALHAPLLLFPLDIQREVMRGRQEYRIRSSGEGMSINLALAERLRRDFGLELPAFHEQDTPESYFSSVQALIQGQAGWKVRSWVTIGLFSFAKISMYQDLAPENWRTFGGLHGNSELIRILCGSPLSRSTPPCKDLPEAPAPESSPHLPPADDHDRSELDIPLVTDADSSQLEVIRSVLAGQSLVIEGPPGTGKSQTITNIIAAAMGLGKSVLFVAEKMAALNVVQKRLADAGLAPFCLELHSTKAGRSETYNAIARRLALPPVHRVDAELDSIRRELAESRAQLTRIAEALGQPAGNLSGTIQELLWRLDRLRCHAYPWAQPFETHWLSSALDWTETQIERTVETIRLFAENRQEILNDHGSPRRSPWFGLACANLDLVNQETIHARIRRLRDVTGEALRVAERVLALTDWRPSRIDDLNLPAISPPDAAADDALLALLRSPDVFAELERFARDLRQFADSHARLQAAFGNTPLPPAEVVRRMVTLAQGLIDPALPLGELTSLTDQRIALAAHLEELAGLLQRLRGFFPEIAWADDGRADQTLVAAARLAALADPEVVSGRTPELASPEAVPVLEKALLERDGLLRTREHLSQHFALEDVPSHQDLRSLARDVRAAPWLPILSQPYRAAKRTWRGFLRKPRRSSRTALLDDLEALASWRASEEAFLGNPTYSRLLGSSWQGLRSPLERALKTARWIRRLMTELNADRSMLGRKLAHTMLTADAGLLVALAELTTHPCFSKLEEATQSSSGEGILPRTQAAQEASARSRSALEAYTSSHLAPHISLHDALLIAADLERFHLLNSQLTGAHSVARRLGSRFQGPQTDPAPLEASLNYVRIIQSRLLPPVLQSWILERDVRSRALALADLAASARDARGAVLEGLKALEEASRHPLTEWLRSPDFGAIDLTDLCDHLNACIADPEGLHRLVRDAQSLEDLDRSGLGDVVRTFCDGANPLDRLIHVCRYLIYKSIAKSLMARHGALAHFSAERHQALRARFRNLDMKLQNAQRRKIMAAVMSRRPPAGSSAGRKDEWTGMRMVAHVTSLQRPRTSIRRFLQQAGRAVQELMPCFMMSPLSVAQYLPQDLVFDLVIMDEASQLRPEDAVGSIARGRQVVIVGDPQQLPPTRFFMDNPSPLEDGDDETLADEESILDAAAQILRPTKRLRWHYRSRHGSLIAFSNQEFYDGDLIVFPSPKERHPDMGVRYEYVADGCYEPRIGINRPEADRIIQAVLQHARTRPERSLGVVALNLKQAELLRTQLEALQERDPDFLSFCTRWSKSLEPLFVKNLENVQGDERDVILISTVYGKDASGTTAQRFGPINQSGGHRRLNVLFTRAKYQCTIFTSLTPEDIRVDERSSRGVRVLHRYLKYARDGFVHPASNPPAIPESDFESSVLEVLHKEGFSAQPQVGVSGYRIDIAVRHPTRPDEFILGIECDGASYHSWKSARDRDRLRQQVLESLGWRIYRIWSLEWYRNPKGEAAKLIRAIQEVAASAQKA